MKKTLLLLLILFCNCSIAQDSIVAKKEKILFTEKDIAIDSSSIEIKTFDKNFKKNYQSKEFVYEIKSKPETAWDRFLKWLGDLIFSLFQFSSNGIAGSLIGIVFKLIIYGVILIAIYFIVKSLVNKEGQWIFGKNSNKKIQYDEVEKNIHNADFKSLINQSIAENNDRLTIRYYYLWLLKKMSDKNLIDWEIEKTNADYLYELKSQADKTQFEYLSYLYNYIWYGEFDLDKASFQKAKQSFETAIKNL